MVVTGNASGLNSTLTKASNRIQKTSRELKGLAGSLPGLGRLSDVLSSFATVAGPLAAVGVAIGGVKLALRGMRSLIGVVNEARTSLDALGKSAATFGIDPTALAALRLAGAEIAGLEESAVDTAIQRFGRRLEDAAAGSKTLAKVFSDLGLDAKELASLPLDVAFKRVSAAVTEIDDKQAQLLVAFKLFDTEGARLVNVLRQGPGVLDEYIRKAAELGGAFTAAEVSGVEGFNDAVGRLGERLSNLGKIFTIQIEPALSEITRSLDEDKETWNDIVDAVIIFAEMMKEAFRWASALARTADDVKSALGGVLGAGVGSSVLDEAQPVDTLSMRPRRAELDAQLRESNARLNAPIERAGVRPMSPILFGPADLAQMALDKSEQDRQAAIDNASRERIEEARRQHELLLEQIRIQKETERHLRNAETARIP